MFLRRNRFGVAKARRPPYPDPGALGLALCLGDLGGPHAGPVPLHIGVGVAGARRFHGVIAAVGQEDFGEGAAVPVAGILAAVGDNGYALIGQ